MTVQLPPEIHLLSRMQSAVVPDQVQAPAPVDGSSGVAAPPYSGLPPPNNSDLPVPAQPLPVPIAPPPSGRADLATQQTLVATLSGIAIGHQENGGPQGNDITFVPPQAAPPGTNDPLHDGTPDGGDSKPPAKAFSIDDVLQLLVREGADGFKEEAQQTQQAAKEKIEFLGSEEADMRSAGKDREFGAIMGGVGTIAQGAAGMVGAGLSGAGFVAGNNAITNANTQLAAGAPEGAPAPTLDAQASAQIYSQASGGYNAWSQGTSSLGTAGQGGLNVGQGTEESAASRADAAKAAAEKGATEEDALHDNAQAMKQQYLSTAQDFVDKRKAMEQSHDETMKAIMRA
ncbi:hypothetical protein [Peristeroidobacter soli]|uniref:hypothetical protein n=1 Tax=Peristeroidobacter soli TaxID=2497877 RepID=UPI00101C2D73|nr:hypothetical protein [Peristeroidobacter soli]